MTADHLHVAREGAELGQWSRGEVLDSLQRGTLLPTDCYWMPPMTEWQPLTQLLPNAGPPPLPPPHSRPADQYAEASAFGIRFGSSFGTDKLGFVRKGLISITRETVELSGPKHWPGVARFGVFLVLYPLLFLFLGFVGQMMPEEGGFLMSVVGLIIGLTTWIGSPLLALMLIHYFCASPGVVKLTRSQISDISRSGRQFAFLVSDSDGRRKPRRASFHAGSVAQAEEIERHLA